MSDGPTLRSISDNLIALNTAMTSFVSAQNVMNESQKATNETNAKTFEKLSDALSKSDSMQVEINGINQKQTEQQFELSNISKDVSGIKTQTAVTKTLVDQTQDIKKIFLKSMAGVFVMFLVMIGSSVYTTTAKTQANAEVAAMIAEMIKNKD